MKKLFLLMFLLLALYSHAVSGEKEGALAIDFTPEIFRLPQAEADNGDCSAELLTLSAKNIQVREKWDVKSSSSFSINDNGVLVFNGATDQEAVVTVIVEDDFSLLNNNYQNLTAQAIITLDIMVQKIFTSGGIVGSSVSDKTWSSANGINWQINNANSFPARLFHTMSPLNGRLYVMGGQSDPNGNNKYKDVWSRSICDNTWQQDTADAGWGTRTGHAVAVLQNTLFLSGGLSNEVQNDVWSTTDGTNWSLLKASTSDDVASVTSWTKRQGHQMVSHQGTLYIMGGRSGSTINSEIYSSVDGKNWSFIRYAPWTNRHLHQVVIHNQRLYLMGGRGTRTGNRLSDVWSSADGTNWSLETNSMGGGTRSSFAVFSYNGRLYVTGGNTNNHVWSSADGKTWQPETDDTTNSGLPIQSGSATAVFPPE